MELGAGHRHVCKICHQKCSTSSNLNRHMKTHEAKAFKCERCGKVFTLKQHLDIHVKKHQRQDQAPTIRLYKPGEALLKPSLAAQSYEKFAKVEKIVVDKVWCDPVSAEALARSKAGEAWRGEVHLTFGKYLNKTFKWLIENDVGWMKFILVEHGIKRDANPLRLWLKSTLWEYADQFPQVMCHIHSVLKKTKSQQPPKAKELPKSKTPPTLQESSKPLEPPMPQEPLKGEIEETDDMHWDFTDDQELLDMADTLVSSSELGVKTHFTTAGDLLKVSQHSQESSRDPGLEGWQKSWEEPLPNTLPIYQPNIHWLKNDLVYGLYNKEGSKKVLKPIMNFNPPPLISQFQGAIPPMLAFFTTPAFFWRPVGVMQLKVPCPNRDCPAPPGYSLARHGYGSVARTVYGMKFPYTLLTERLICNPCMDKRKSAGDDDKRQYSWNASSLSILQQLPPAVRSMFPAVIVGKRAIDKEVVTLLSDRVNSVSMTKVYRVLEMGHSKWYAERRDWYQTLLFKAHSADTSDASQRGILSFIKAPGSYTPPIPQSVLPSPRTLRRAHMIMEMERMPFYRESILSVTGEILCIDGTKQILKKVYGDGQDTMHFLTSILNEWGQFVTAVVVASESEDCYQRMARGLCSRFRRANAPAPKVMYTDNNCCRDGGTSWMESLFQDWVQDGMLIRLDIRHWLHRWDAVVIKQTHSKYGAFMSAMAGAILAYSNHDMMKLTSAIRKGNEALYAGYSDQQMIRFVTPHQLKSYVRRVTRGVEESACAIEAILEDFKGDAGLDIDNIHLFKSSDAVDAHWAIASKHLGCMQDPPDIPLYVAMGTANINGVQLNRYRCCRGSNTLEGLHSHLVNCIPSKRCGIMPFQVSLVAFMLQWNKRMEAHKISSPHSTSLTDPRLIQRLNHHSELLFGREHIFDPNFVAPMPLPATYEVPYEEELIGVEYSYCQSTDFTSKDYYIRRAEEEQAKEDEKTSDEEEDDDIKDEGIVGDSNEPDDPIDDISVTHAVLVKSEQVTTDASPLLDDVLAKRKHLHLPGYEEVEKLALLLIKLTDDSDEHLIPANLRLQISNAAAALLDHDRSVKSFVKQYESKWGHTLFGRVHGPESPQNSAAQKTKFGWMRYAQASSITEESRLLYVVIKMLKNRPKASSLSSPTKIASLVKGQYKRIVDRVRDDKVLAELRIPLPNINVKSVTNFLNKENKRVNYLSTVIPKAPSHRRVLTSKPVPDAPSLPKSLVPPDRPQVQYPTVPLEIRKVRGQKRKLDFDSPQTHTPQAAPTLPSLLPRPSVKASPLSQAPILMVVPSQPSAPSVSFVPSRMAPFTLSSPPPPPPPPKPFMPKQSKKPCAACGKPNCDGQRKRYVPSKDKVKRSMQKSFTFCSLTRESVSPGYTGRVYESYDDFKAVVDAELAKH